jgi:type IX secretion system PorP/SprF family membrane protein
MKNMNKATLYILILCGIMTANISRAQFDPMFTQYMFNELAINPAYAGARECLSGTALYRQQWVGLDGAPSTITGTVHAPLMQQKVGVGLTFMNDKIGVSQRTSVTANGAYRIHMNSANLSFGLQLGLVSLSENLAQLDLQQDQQFSSNTGKRTAPNFGFGMYYSTPKWYAGFSIPRMLQNKMDVSSGSTEVKNQLKASDFHYLITGGSVHAITEAIKLRPNVMMKVVSGAPIQLDLNANVLFSDFIWTGLGYRSGDAINLMIGAYITKQLRLGYSYDYTLSALQDFNTGSHEIMLGYDLNFSKDKVITPRYF